MKTALSCHRLRRLAFAPLALGLLLLAGCLEKSFLWSPDGRRAVLLGTEGLYLCDVDGRLSDLLVPGAYRAAWLGDSQQLVVACVRPARNWPEIALALGPDAGVVAARASALEQKLRGGGAWGELMGGLVDQLPHQLIRFYLREHAGETLRARLDAEEWTALQALSIELHTVSSARLTDGRLTLGPALHAGVGRIQEIRLAPGDRAVALVEERPLPEAARSGEELQLRVVRLDAPGTALVAGQVARFPDWSADGRSLVYVQAAAGTRQDEVRLGTLMQRAVLDATGAVALTSPAQELAGWLFADTSRVRCLRDGRILFNAAEVSLPVAAGDSGVQREQLFAFDPARQATLVRLVPRQREPELPQTLAFFEVSPDEQQVLFGDLHGAVAVLTLAGGAVEQVQAAVKDTIQGQPVWRQRGEFSYTRLATGPAGVAPMRRAEIVLRRAGQEQVLSTTWPAALVNHLVSAKP